MKREGKILFIAATHGDEGFSVDVFKSLGRRYPRSKYGYDRTVGNPRALRKRLRYIEADLNRSAPGDPRSGVYEKRRAAQIIELCKGYKLVIDVHGTVADSGIVAIIPYPTLPNLMLASMLPIERKVIWYAKSSLEQGPLVQFTDCPGIEIECGPKSSEQLKTGLETVLSTFLKMRATASFDQLVDNLKGKAFYNVYGRLDGDGRDYTDFVLAKDGDEEFFPFLANQYPGIACYKMKKIQLGVMGSCADLKYSKKIEKMAEEVGYWVAKKKAILIFGAEKDFDSLSTAACRGAKKAGGITVGVTYEKGLNVVEKNVDVVIASGLARGGGRELPLVLSCDAIIAISGGSGTLTEIAIAYQANIPIVVLKGSGGWSDKLAGEYLDSRERIKAEAAKNPKEAVELALKLIKKKYGQEK